MTSYVTPKKNSAFIMYVGLPDSAASYAYRANPTLAAGDAKVSIDGGAFANLGTLPAATPAAGKSVKISLASGEMNGDNITVVLADQTSPAEWSDVIVNIQTSAQQIDDLATQASVNTVDDFLDTEIAAIKTQTDKLTFTVANQIDANVLDWKSATAPAMTGDAFARLGAPVGASISADIAAVKAQTASIETKVDTIDDFVDTEVAAIKTQTDKLTFTVANQIDANVLDWKSATAPAMTGDAFARLGAPAGASVSADIAAAKVDTAAIKAKTDSLTFTVAGMADANVVDWKGAAAPAMTGDSFARLGAPAGASVAADIAAIKAQTASIETKVDTVDDFVDTEVSAIKAKTDQLVFTTANRVDAQVFGMQANVMTAAAAAADLTTELQAGLATAAALAVVDGIVDDILLDTAEIGTAGAGLTNINLPNQTMDIVGNITGSLSGSVGSVTGNVGGNVVGSVGSVTGLTASNLDATISSRASAANLATVASYVDTEITALQTSVDDLPTNAELATALGVADDAVLAQVALVKAKTDNLPSDPADASVIAGLIAGLNNLSVAQVNAEVVDALATDTYPEPAQGAPGSNIALSAKIGFIFKAWRNRTTQTADEYALYADDGTTKDHEATVSDDGTTFERGEVRTGA